MAGRLLVLFQLHPRTAHEIDGAAKATLLWTGRVSILRADRNFTWLLVCRMLSQFGIMAFSFYAVHVVKNLGASEIQAGIMTSVLMTYPW